MAGAREREFERPVGARSKPRRDCAFHSRFCIMARLLNASESDSKVIPMFPGLCETAGEEADAGDQDPGLGAGDGRLEVLGQAAVAAEPGESAFDHPSLWLGFEGADTLGAG